MGDSVFVHILTFNSRRYLKKCVHSVLLSEGLQSFSVHITDNASGDSPFDELIAFLDPKLSWSGNSENLGFCAGHNQGVKRFLETNCGYFLVLNPDVVLEKSCIKNLCAAIKADSSVGLATPKLFRASENLDSVSPPVLDAAGMVLVSSLRHFDRGSNEIDCFESDEDVFGGTGACLLLSRACVEDLLLQGKEYDQDKAELFPQLSVDEGLRAPLFDEAFFAYREDADLSWRAKLLGWRCRFVSKAVGYHKREVLTTNRSETSATLNGISVRNRFLLQINNYFCSSQPLLWFLNGFIFRNLVVVFACFLFEPTSLSFLFGLKKVWRRAFERRRLLVAKMRQRN